MPATGEYLRRVCLRARISKGGRHLKQAKNADGLAISRGDEVTAEQDAEQQQIKGDMCNNRADAGQSRVACEWRGRWRETTPDKANHRDQHQDNANAFMQFGRPWYQPS